jgi:hypothetical protein
VTVEGWNFGNTDHQKKRKKKKRLLLSICLNPKAKAHRTMGLRPNYPSIGPAHTSQKIPHRRVSFYSVHLGTRRRQRRRLAAAAATATARRQPSPLPPRPSLNKGIRMALRAARRLASCSRQGRLLLPSPAPAPAPCNRTAAPAAAFLHSHATSFGTHPCYPSLPLLSKWRS